MKPFILTLSASCGECVVEQLAPACSCFGIPPDRTYFRWLRFLDIYHATPVSAPMPDVTLNFFLKNVNITELR